MRCVWENLAEARMRMLHPAHRPRAQQAAQLQEQHWLAQALAIIIEHMHSDAAGALAVKDKPGGPNMDGNVSKRQTKEGSPGVTAVPPSLVGKPNPGRWLRRAEE